MPTPTFRRIARAVVPVAVIAGLAVGGAGIASAHVTAHSPDPLTQGSYAEIVFRAPNEQATANFTKLEVDFSTTSPIPGVDVKPLPGWDYQVTMVQLATPVRMARDTVTSAVKSIVWTAQPGSGVKPGELQEFTITANGLPTNTTDLTMPAIQSYDNGVTVDWNQPETATGPEPEHPAPHLSLVSPTQTAAVTPTVSSADITWLWLSGIALLLAALALGFGLGAFTRSRQVRRLDVEPEEGIAPPEPEEAAHEASR
jgi:uncharacterized protein YcnI